MKRFLHFITVDGMWRQIYFFLYKTLSCAISTMLGLHTSTTLRLEKVSSSSLATMAACHSPQVVISSRVDLHNCLLHHFFLLPSLKMG